MSAIFLREIKVYFSSLLAWSITAAYLVIVGFIMAFSLGEYSTISMSAMQGGRPFSVMGDFVPPLISTFGFLLLFFLPLLTMRLFAEEKRQGTLDLLFTYPISEAAMVCGKFFAAMFVVLIMLALTSCGFLIMAKYIQLEWQVLACGYLGLMLLAGSFIAFGMLTSSLTSSQLIASSTTYVGLLLLWIISGLDNKGYYKDLFGDLSAVSHLDNMVRGVFSTQDIVYYAALILFFLYLTVRVLESRKWRG